MVYLPWQESVTGSLIYYECLYQTVLTAVPVFLSRTRKETLLYKHIQMLCGPVREEIIAIVS